MYSMYSRKTESEVWENLKGLGVDYAILEDSWCTRAAKFALAFFLLSLFLALLKSFSTDARRYNSVRQRSTKLKTF